MDPTLVSVVALIGVALTFDYINGFHDAANSIATVVSTRVLTPRLAVVWAAFFNFVAFLIFGTHVANTMNTVILISPAGSNAPKPALATAAPAKPPISACDELDGIP